MSDKKREEQIKEGARQRADQYDHPSQWSDTYYGFIDGAHWADKHPQWIPVEKELPKYDVDENGLITYPYQEVLVSLYDGYVDTDTYDTQLKAWWKYEGEVEYWMPKPQPPRKE